MSVLSIIVLILVVAIVLYGVLVAVDFVARAIIVRFFLLPGECRACLRSEKECVCAARNTETV